jgi:lysozyme family protein
MTTFEQCIPVILNNEGGSAYTETPNDPGGATKYGISLLFLRKVSLLDGDIDHDGDIDAADIKAMSEQKAEHLYQEYFWNTNFEKLNVDLLVLHIFDHSVNAGSKTAIRLAQQIVHVFDDGSLGPVTDNALNSYHGDMVGQYINARKSYYNSIVAKNSHLQRFLKGWFNRINNTHF